MAMEFISPELSTKYTLTGFGGVRAVFNDPTDADYVGVLTEITGLDSAEVREEGDVLPGRSGGMHGQFLHGRRPITLTGKVFGHATSAARSDRLGRLQAIVGAAVPYGEVKLSWARAGGDDMTVAVRTQQPLRVSGAWVKEFQVALVAPDYRIYQGSSFQTVAMGSPNTTINLTGTAPVSPRIRFQANLTHNTAFTIGMYAAGVYYQALTLTPDLVALGYPGTGAQTVAQIEIDCDKHTIKAMQSGGTVGVTPLTTVYNWLSPTSEWPVLDPYSVLGNVIRYSGSIASVTGGAVDYRNAWY